MTDTVINLISLLCAAVRTNTDRGLEMLKSPEPMLKSPVWPENKRRILKTCLDGGNPYFG